MAKQQTLQRYIFKIHTKRLKAARWNLQLTLEEARANDEIISIGDSQMLRWIDELNGVVNADKRARDVRRKIKEVKSEPHSVRNRNMIKKLYGELDAIQFKPDYVSVVADTKSDFKRACKGFKINGKKYTRLVGTSGGVKQSTVIFTTEELAPILRSRIDNGRNMSMKFVPAKLEAYRALTCSGSTPVSMPRGVIVVNDCETQFVEDVINISPTENGEPVAEKVANKRITIDCSDGCGMMTPSLAERWSEELRLPYVCGGMTIRNAFTKGMVFCFDFREFASEVAGNDTVIDAWGDKRNVLDAELILTTSMLKLWDSYSSMEAFFDACDKNKYTFAITKTTPKELDTYRSLNYQFIQSYELDDEQLDQLLEPTITDFKDLLSGDYRKAILFLCGLDLDDGKVDKMEGCIGKALMADPRIFQDPYVRQNIYSYLRGAIQRAKIGVIGVHGNYSILSGDLYALCQSMFGLPVTGLLKAGEIYNHYWMENSDGDVVCFRAPMSSHNNIVRMSVNMDDEVSYWFRYIKTGTIINAWDTATAALNGCD